MRGPCAIVVLVASLLANSACNEEGVVRIHSVKFDGVTAVDQNELRSALATREDSKVPLIGVRLPWAKSRNFFDRSRFDADLKRIEAFYADRGYPEARVASFDVKLNDKQDSVDVTLRISEGAPIRVAAVNFTGFDPAIPADHLQTLTRQTRLGIGKPRERAAVVAVHELAINELRDHGYPYAKVGTAETLSPDGHEATVTFTAEPGPLSHFGPIEIAGNNSVSNDVIRRQLTIKPGDLYRRSAIQDTQRRLYSMELFQFVNVETLNPESQDPDVQTRVTVAEGKHQRFNGGIGYGTDERARVDAEYHHVNFLGGARTAGVHGRYSRLDKGLRFDFIQPYIFNPRLSLGLDGQDWYTYTPAYNSLVQGGRVSLVRNRSSRTTWTVSLASEFDSSTVSDEALNDPALFDDLIALGIDPTTQKQSGTLSSLGFDFQRSTTDNLLNAHRGYQIGLHAEQAGHWLPGTFNYNAYTADVRHFLPVSKTITVANRVQFGDINATDGDPKQIPFSKKYFLGGASSLRGWGRFEVSPLGGSGSPIGGDTLFAFSTELRAQLKSNIGGVLFLDGGNVWATNTTGTDLPSERITLSDLRYDAGVGLRYQTPIGPIRLDFGYQLTPIDGLLINGEPETRHWRIHFSVGQAF